MFLNQRDKAKDSAVKEGVHSIQIGIQSYAVDANDDYPTEVNSTSLADYVDNWPNNPWENRAMADSTTKGDYTYEDLGTTFRLTGHMADDQSFVVGAPAEPEE